MKALLKLTALSFPLLMLSCTIIKPGEVGVKRKIGKLSNEILDQGPHGYNPFTTKIIKTNIQTQNLELSLNLPSKEGLNVTTEISILYKIEKTKVPLIIENLGANSVEIIRSVFRSASADVCSKFVAKDMHSGKRADIEKEISISMNKILKEQGIVIEVVLLKSVKLPVGLYGSIESKLEAEQSALRMQFILQQEELEAERKVIEAKGIRDAQLIISEGLTPEIIQLKSIDAFIKLSESEGTKIIVTDGNAPFLINDQITK
jgi:regulator of protease activity HflC (stomatin/prohibitin superfamily)